MIIRKAYKLRLKTNLKIEGLMFQFSGCNRKVWNMALALQKDSLEQDKKVLSYNHFWTRVGAISFEWLDKSRNGRKES